MYISRRSDPLDEAGAAISPEEWRQQIASETDFRVPAVDEGKHMGQHGRMWTGYKYPVAFDWVDGQVDVKNPDATIIARMKALAGKLGANVFSETGELYDDNGAHAGFLQGFP